MAKLQKEKYLFLCSATLLFLQYYLIPCLGVSPDIITDQTTLLALKDHLNTSGNVFLLDWSTDISCCNWTRITCDSRQQRVTSLNLSSMGITGTIPPLIGKLTGIKQLDLYNNTFSGSIPEEIGNLTILTDLLLGRNELSGSIPKEIGNLTMLTKLYLNVNKLSGNIPKEIGNLIRVTELDLTSNTLDGEIPWEIGNLASLNFLAFARNKLSGSIPKVIGNLTMLQRLFLDKNELSGSIPKIGNLTMLTNFHLGFNNLHGGIPYELGHLQNLKSILLSTCGMSGSIPPKIFNMSTLEMMDLNFNNLKGQLPPSFGVGLVNMKELFLANNLLSGAIPRSISNASMLTKLELSSNSFNGFIPDTLGTLQFLTYLNLEYNSLTIDSSLQELRFLTSLTFCQNLRVLHLSGNDFDGILPISVGNFSTSLEILMLSDCNIKGHIPREIGNISNVITLGLDYNTLSGSIPITIGKLQRLQGLGFAENNLEGHIPYDLCLLKTLITLTFSSNKLSGPIPTCIGNLTSLLQLSLSSNKLTSTIPFTLEYITGIITLDLSSNLFSGSIPLEIGGLKQLTKVDISHNRLSGNIPTALGNLQSLVNLSLTHNKLLGLIPPSFEKLISLEFLDLSDNNLTGAIPMSLEKLKYLKFLNVSFNRLHGEIPNGGPFVNFSAESFMLNDELCGAPQFKVPPCKNNTSSGSRDTIVLILKYVLPAIVIVVVVLIFVIVRCRKKSEMIPIQKLYKLLTIVPLRLFSTQTKLLPNALRRIMYNDIVQATDGFNENNLLGKGSFGIVYKAIFSNGEIFAIKVFNLQLEGAFKSFDVECEVLRSIRHRNLIKIITSCSNHDFKALVLEYMPNGSLDMWLYSHKYYLNLLQRLNIMIDVASALDYLHHGYATPIVHCDLKPSNILLDVDMVAHVGDFGISKLLGEGDSMRQTMTLATIGYMAPEYGTQGIVSTKCDIYSYGIMLLETFTRKKPTDEYFTDEMNFKRWVSDSLSDSVSQVADYNLLRSDEEHLIANNLCISSVLALGLNCCADSPEQRIDMKDVVVRLVNIKKNISPNSTKKA